MTFRTACALAALLAPGVAYAIAQTGSGAGATQQPQEAPRMQRIVTAGA